MEIRQLKSEDIPVLVTLIKELFIRWEKVEKYDKLDYDYIDSIDFTTSLEKQIKKFMVAVIDSTIVGFIDFEIKERPKIYEIKKEGHINLLYVKRDFRKKGIGRMLIETAMNFFNENDIEFQTVTTYGLDKDANLFWEKRRFRLYNKVRVFDDKK